MIYTLMILLTYYLKIQVPSVITPCHFGYGLHWAEGLWCLQFQTKYLLRPPVVKDKGDVTVQNIRNIVPTTQCHIPEDLNIQ
jgi:hypothetical protein